MNAATGSKRRRTPSPSDRYDARLARGRRLLTLDLPVEVVAELDACVERARAEDPKASRSTVIHQALKALQRSEDP
jgi:hypothetical protein